MKIKTQTLTLLLIGTFISASILAPSTAWAIASYICKNPTTGAITIRVSKCKSGETKIQNISALTGATGASGTNGTNGSNGTNGTNGVNGADGRNGASGFSLINGGLSASVSANALTIAVKDSAGNDPSANNPVLVNFRDPTATSGAYSTISLTAATSFVLSAGSTLGMADNVPFKIWIVGVNDGTFHLGVIVCKAPAGVSQLRDDILASGFVLEDGTGQADERQRFYVNSNLNINPIPLRVIGYAEYSAGLPTVGNYSVAPSKVQLFGPGVSLPGTPVQVAFGILDTNQTSTSTSFVTTSLSQYIVPSSTANLIMVNVAGTGGSDSGTDAAIFRLYRENTVLASAGGTYSSAGPAYGSIAFNYLDAPATTASTTYDVRFATQNAAVPARFNVEFGGIEPEISTIVLTEIAG